MFVYVCVYVLTFGLDEPQRFNSSRRGVCSPVNISGTQGGGGGGGGQPLNYFQNLKFYQFKFE